VGDDDQLGALLQLGEDAEQPLQVAVVKRRLDLVEHVERRRPRLEDREEVRDRGQRPLAARQQGEPLDLLARRARLDLDAGGQHVIRLGQHEPARAAGEEPREQPLELTRGVGVGGGEHLLHPVVDLLDHREQVAAGLAQVFKLGGEELVPLYQRLVLLKRERVDLAQPGELPVRLRRPLLLLRPHVRHGDGLGLRLGFGGTGLAGRDRGLSLFHLGPHRPQGIRERRRGDGRRRARFARGLRLIVFVERALDGGGSRRRR